MHMTLKEEKAMAARRLCSQAVPSLLLVSFFRSGPPQFSLPSSRSKRPLMQSLLFLPPAIIIVLLKGKRGTKVMWRRRVRQTNWPFLRQQHLRLVSSYPPPTANRRAPSSFHGGRTLLVVAERQRQKAQ